MSRNQMHSIYNDIKQKKAANPQIGDDGTRGWFTFVLEN